MYAFLLSCVSELTGQSSVCHEIEDSLNVLKNQFEHSSKENLAFLTHVLSDSSCDSLNLEIAIQLANYHEFNFSEYEIVNSFISKADSLSDLVKSIFLKSKLNIVKANIYYRRKQYIQSYNLYETADQNIEDIELEEDRIFSRYHILIGKADIMLILGLNDYSYRYFDELDSLSRLMIDPIHYFEYKIRHLEYLDLIEDESYLTEILNTIKEVRKLLTEETNFRPYYEYLFNEELSFFYLNNEEYLNAKNHSDSLIMSFGKLIDEYDLCYIKLNNLIAQWQLEKSLDIEFSEVDSCEIIYDEPGYKISLLEFKKKYYTYRENSPKVLDVSLALKQVQAELSSVDEAIVIARNELQAQILNSHKVINKDLKMVNIELKWIVGFLIFLVLFVISSIIFLVRLKIQKADNQTLISIIENKITSEDTFLQTTRKNFQEAKLKLFRQKEISFDVEHQILTIKEKLDHIQNELKNKNLLNQHKLMEIDAHFSSINLNALNSQSFESLFTALYPGFLEKIHHNFPKLSKADLRHCAYIKLGFNTKEVALILSIKPNTVKIKRYRIKKKMNIPHRDLKTFFESFQSP